MIVSFLLFSLLISAFVNAAPAAKRQTSLDADFIHFANFAGASYCENGLSSLTCGPSCNPLSAAQAQFVQSFDSALEAQGFIAVDPSRNSIVVSYRGTSAIENVLVDIDLILSDFPPGSAQGARAHSGFQRAYGTIAETIRTSVGDLLQQNPGMTVTLTGHSLGAAMAILSAVDLVDSGVVPAQAVQVFSYGQPRVGNQAFANFYDSLGVRTFRVTNRQDPVAIIPPRIIGYRHHAQEFFVDDPEAQPTTTISCTTESRSCAKANFVSLTNVGRHLSYMGVAIGDCA